MFLYKVVRHPHIATLVCGPLVAMALALVLQNVLPTLVLGVGVVLPWGSIGVLSALAVFGTIKGIERRGGYVPKDQRVWFVVEKLAPQLRDVVETLKMGMKPSQVTVKELLADYWAVFGTLEPSPMKKALDAVEALAALIELQDSFSAQNLTVMFARSRNSKDGRRVAPHPRLIIRQGATGPVLLDTNK